MNRSSSSLLYIPTNRLCPEAIVHAAYECRIISNITQGGAVLTVIDQPSGVHTAANEKTLGYIASDLGVPYVYVSETVWADVCGTILAALGTSHDRAVLSELLNRRGVAYGVAVNRAYLIAAALGVGTLYRRDSDHLPTLRDNEYAYPAVLEARAVGRTLDELVIRAERGVSEPILFSSRLVSWVGSNMYGEAPIDRRDLLSADLRLAIELDALAHPSRSYARIRERLSTYYVVEPSLVYTDDFYEIDTTGRTEVGVSCVQGLFLELPEMPIRDTLGCDYMGKNLLYQLRRPMLYHSRKMRHIHDAERTVRSPEQAADYALRDLRYVLLRRIWNHHNIRIRGLARLSRPGAEPQLNEEYAASFLASLKHTEELTAGVVPEYHRIYAEAAAVSYGSARRRLKAVAEAVHVHGDQAISQVADGVREFCCLVSAWRPLVAAAQNSQSAVRARLSRAGTVS